MANRADRQTLVEVETHYCRTCGHAKEVHNLDFRGDPTEAHQLFVEGEYVCNHMTGDHSAHHCICVAWNGWA